MLLLPTAACRLLTVSLTNLHSALASVLLATDDSEEDKSGRLRDRRGQACRADRRPVRDREQGVRPETRLPSPGGGRSGRGSLPISRGWPIGSAFHSYSNPPTTRPTALL